MAGMTKEERESFLADVHVGVISIEQAGSSPLSVPIWYDYSQAVGLWLITEKASPKGKCIEAAGRFSLLAQTETRPYQYVSVEGPVIETRVCDPGADLLPMAARYLGAEEAGPYTDGFRQLPEGAALVYVMRPEVWRTAIL